MPSICSLFVSGHVLDIVDNLINSASKMVGDLPGVILMQLVNQAKNITELRAYGDQTFRAALSELVQDDAYLESTTKEKLTLIRKLTMIILSKRSTKS